jgi:two-component system cell cycle response regulator DivK
MGKTVLIVEDNELNMKLFRDLLEAHGIATLETRDGHGVLNIARDQKPDLILMDIQLPEVSGLDVTKWLKADEGLKSIPVIAVTAFAMKGDEEKIRQGGCEDYISKPISVSRFMEVIQKHLKDKDEPAVAEEASAIEEVEEISFEIRPRDDEEDFEDEEFFPEDEGNVDEDFPDKKETDL